MLRIQWCEAVLDRIDDQNFSFKIFTILLRDPDDKDLLRAILSDHVETEACYFHTQHQMFVEAKISKSQVEEIKEEDVKK